MSRRRLCLSWKHVWRRIRGSRVEKCIACGTRFPCARETCGHYDCHEERGEVLPSGIRAVA